MSAISIAAIVIAAAVGFILLGLLTKAVAAGVSKVGEAKIAARFPGGGIVKKDPMANSLGQTSKGAAQLRGNGALVLTADTLHFLGIGRDDLVIPLKEITAVTTVKSHLGKSLFRPLLKVDFKVDFSDDGIAFYVRDLQGWLSALEQQRAK